MGEDEFHKAARGDGHGFPVVPDDADAAAEVFVDGACGDAGGVAGKDALVHDGDAEFFLDHGDDGVVVVDFVFDLRFEAGSLEGAQGHVEVAFIEENEGAGGKIAQADAGLARQGMVLGQDSAHFVGVKQADFHF